MVRRLTTITSTMVSACAAALLLLLCVLMTARASLSLSSPTMRPPPPAVSIASLPTPTTNTKDSYTLQDASSSCSNNCTNQGTCSSGGFCICNLNQVGPNCNTTVAAASLGDGVTVSSTIIGSYVYVQFVCPATGYCGIMISPGSDGMTGGDLWLFADNGLEDRRGGSGQVTPDPASYETQDLINGTSWTDNGARVMAFARLLHTGDTHDTDISATDTMSVSYAYSGALTFVQHSSSQRGIAVVNFALGTASPSGKVGQKQILVPVAIGVFVLILSFLFLHIGDCRRSSCGHSCLRVKCCPRACSGHTERNTLDEITLDARFALQNMVWSELFIVVAYIISVIGYCKVAQRSYDDVSRDYMYVSGQLAGWHLALTILPISRTAPWVTLMGISFERAVKWHRWVARVTVLMATIHAGLMYKNKVTSSTDLTAPTLDGQGVIFGTLAWICFLLISAMAYEPVRRRFFELFYYTHHLSILGIVFACLHSTTTLYCCIIGIVFWGIDRCIRFYRSRRHVTVKNARVLKGSETVSHLMLHLPNFKYKGGDFAFINVPSISLTQWHPFSISSSDNGDGTFSFHIMAMGMGDKAWTDQLAEAVPQIATGERSIYVDGPYGNLSVALYKDYSHVILAAGGIGITPMISILRELFVKYVSGNLRHVESVHLIWCCSNETPLRTWFPKLLAQIQQHGAPFHLHMYATGAKKPNKNPDTWLQTAALENGTYVTTASGATTVGTAAAAPTLVAPVAADGNASAAPSSSATSSSTAIQIGIGGDQKTAPVAPSAPPSAASPAATAAAAAANSDSASLKVVTGQRPQFSQLFDSILQSVKTRDGNQVAVLTCGPHPMIQVVQTEAAARHFHLHKETFFL